MNSIYEEILLRSEQVVVLYEVENNRFMFLNPAFEAVWSIAAESVKKDPLILINTIYRDDRGYVRRVFNNLETGLSRNIEFRITTPNEDIRWVAGELFVFEHQEKGKILAAFLTDKTDAKANYNNVRKFAAKKDSVLEILSHDLSGPLGNIRNLSELLSDRLQEVKDPEIDKILNIMDRTTSRSIKLIREFVKQEFLESSNVDLMKSRVDLVEKIKEVIEQYNELEENVHKHFELHTSAESVYISIDNYKFMQVLNNLISNSIKFTHDGGIISITIEGRENNVLVIVKDNGIGIPKEYHNSLFEKFTPGRRPGLKGEPSIGLGMSIIKTIVDWHKGRIWFESEENKGTTFYIELPKE